MKYKTQEKKSISDAKKKLSTPLGKIRVTKHKINEKLSKTNVKYRTIQHHLPSPVRRYTEKNSQKSSVINSIVSPKTTAVGSIILSQQKTNKSSTLSNSLSPQRTLRKVRKGAPIREVHLKLTNN
jgi:hypothetical protein